MEQLDTPGCMGTVPRQESVSNCSMHPREFLNGTIDLPYLRADVLILKNMIRPLASIFLEGTSCIIVAAAHTAIYIHCKGWLGGSRARRRAPPHAGSEPAAYKRRTDVDSIVPTAYRDFTSAVQIYYCKIVLCMDGFLEIHLLVYLRKRTICLRKISFFLIQNSISWHRNL
jgi:hypothetical protein